MFQKGKHMNHATKIKNPSLQDCVNFLNESLKIVRRDSPKYYLRDASKVAEEEVSEVCNSLMAVSTLLSKFSKCWIDSTSSGPDAILTSYKLSERIDTKLVQTGKLDFQQFRKIITRMSRADDVLRVPNQISLHIDYFLGVCTENGLERPAKTTRLFIEHNLNRVIDWVKSDGERYANQIDRCNLYFQNVLKSRTFKVAIGSLFVSSLAVLLTILIHFLPDILKLLVK